MLEAVYQTPTDLEDVYRMGDRYGNTQDPEELESYATYVVLSNLYGDRMRLSQAFWNGVKLHVQDNYNLERIAVEVTRVILAMEAQL